MTLSEALATFADNIPDIRKACVLNVQYLEKKYYPAYKLPDRDDITIDDIRAHVNYLLFTKEAAHYLRTIRRIDSNKKSKKIGGITDAHIERAKDSSLIELYGGKVSSRGRLRVGLCPFHIEKTPSFTIYPDNRFKCFGCGEHGDSIAFIMKTEGCDFITAVKKLCR